MQRIKQMNVSFQIRHALFVACLTVGLISCSSTKSSSQTDKEGYEPVFDGKSLAGWTYDPVYWRVENGILTGEITPATILKRNSFIIKNNLIVKDFDLKAEFRITAAGNSGINYRSEVIDSLPYAMRGYQADIDGANRYTGQNYEERARTTLAYRGQVTVIDPVTDGSSFQDNVKNNAWIKAKVTGSLGSADALLAVIKKGDWNECHIIAKGNRLQHYINGVLMSDVTDNDISNRKLSGKIGVQVHVGPPMKIEYRNFRIKNL